MLLTAVDRIIDRPGWSAEPKIDGYRGMAYGDAGSLISRNNKNLTRRFPELADVLERFGRRGAIVDGEIAVFVDGVPSFESLQAHRGHATFVAFDVLTLGGQSTIHLPLEERRVLLARLIPRDVEFLIRMRAFPSAVALLEQAELGKLEGIVYKNDASTYRPGPQRTRDWLKIKTTHGRREEKRRQESWGHARPGTSAE